MEFIGLRLIGLTPDERSKLFNETLAKATFYLMENPEVLLEEVKEEKKTTKKKVS